MTAEGSIASVFRRFGERTHRSRQKNTGLMQGRSIPRENPGKTVVHPQAEPLCGIRGFRTFLTKV